MSEQKLKNAPLREVIFELFWEGTVLSNDPPQDLEFENALGKFQDRISEIAPTQKRLYPPSIPIKLFNMPMFQYWKGELKWPVIQHGPGMISIHETETNYTWKDYFSPLIIKVIDKLHESYRGPLQFSRVSLKYIDATDVPDGRVRDFVNENLGMRLDIQFKEPGKPVGFSLLQQYELEDQSLMQLQVNSGANNLNKSPAVVWITTVEKKGPLKREHILDWINDAHFHCSKIFKTMLKPEFYASLDK